MRGCRSRRLFFSGRYYLAPLLYAAAMPHRTDACRNEHSSSVGQILSFNLRVRLTSGQVINIAELPPNWAIDLAFVDKPGNFPLTPTALYFIKQTSYRRIASCIALLGYSSVFTLIYAGWRTVHAAMRGNDWMLERLTTVVVVAMLCALSATAQEPARIFNPSKLKGSVKGVPNEVLVLGTAHLTQLPATFQPASLRILTTRLLDWRPQIIAIERLSGPQCAFMRQNLHRYKDSVQTYCWDTAPARAATGLDVPAATAEIDRLLANWPAAPTPSQRRHLAAVFLAGGESVSALVQWLRLPQAERHAGDGLDANLVAALDKRNVGRGERGEDVLIAAPLAAALGLERVYSMDDQTADAPDSDQEAYGEAITKAWNNPATTKRRQMDEILSPRLDDAEGVMALYRALNAPSQARLIYDSDFGAALKEDSPQQFGRGYVAYWETRNLRMASNIREAIGKLPGSRTLVIVGASHKGYLEAYLNQMHDVRIVPSDHVLR
jgi:hypothetical protein